jgi:hypothetical protein
MCGSEGRSVPQGVAALLAFNFEHGVDENDSDMAAAAFGTDGRGDQGGAQHKHRRR